MERVELLPDEKEEIEEKIYSLSLELEQAKEDRRLAVQEGDLSENASYEVTNETISRLSKEIGELEQIVNNSFVIDTNKIDKGRVGIGTKVTLRVEDGEELNLSFVGDNRGCAVSGKISRMSLIGGAIFGKTEGSSVTIRDNYGQNKTYSIVKIS